MAPDRIIQNSAAVATTNLLRQQSTVVVPPSNHLTSSAVSPYSLPHAANFIPEKQPAPTLSSVHVQAQSSDFGLTMKKNITTANAASVNLQGTHSHLELRSDTRSYVKPVANLSVREGLSNSLPQSFMLTSRTPSHPATQQQRHHPHLLHQAHFTEPSYRNPVQSYPPQIEKPGPSDLWRERQDVSSSYHSQRIHNNYNTLIGESMQSGSYDRNNDGSEGFETWSPENSPTRNPRYVPGRNFPESRMNNVRNPRHEWSRQRGSSGNWGPDRHGNKRWNDQRR